MAAPACLRLADEVFPRVRARAAHLLKAQRWSQGRIAAGLGVSQAMVSRYLAREVPEDVLAARLAQELVQELTDGAPVVGPSPWCTTLTAAGADGSEALKDLLHAERRLLEGPPLRLVPQIGLNLVRALPDAVSELDILGYPGRIVEAGGRLAVPVAPVPGGSGHLARCLLRLRQRDPQVQALASVRGGPDVLRAMERLDGPVADVGDLAEPDPDRRFASALENAAPDVRLVHDGGGPGLEPCLYVAGPDARIVLDTLLDLDLLVTP